VVSLGVFFFRSYRRNHVSWVDSASKNEYQDTPGGKGGRCIRVTTLPPSYCWKSRKSGALTYRNLLDHLGLSRDTFTFTFFTSLITLCIKLCCRSKLRPNLLLKQERSHLLRLIVLLHEPLRETKIFVDDAGPALLKLLRNFELSSWCRVIILSDNCRLVFPDCLFYYIKLSWSDAPTRFGVATGSYKGESSNRKRILYSIVLF
jgi:hypothetical protein